jgi:hypothetical protein
MPAINVARTDTFEVQRVKINQLGNQIFDITQGGSDLATGNLKLGDGTRIAPSLAFTSDNSLGIYKSGENKFGFVASGRKLVDIELESSVFYKDIIIQKNQLLTGKTSFSSAGSGYDPGSYTNILLSGGTGSNALSTIIVEQFNGSITNSGENYNQGSFTGISSVGGSGTGTEFEFAISGIEGDITAGSGYIPGNYTGISLTGGSGTGVEANVTITGNTTTSGSITNAGSGYSNGTYQSISVVNNPIQTFVLTSTANPGTPPPNNVYVIDGNTQQVLNFVIGNTYRFDISSASLVGHPFGIVDQLNQPLGSEILLIQKGTPGQTGSFIDVVIKPTAQVQTAQYICFSHVGMGANINIITGTAGQYGDALSANIETDLSGQVSNFQVVNSGDGYQVGDVLSVYIGDVGSTGSGFEFTISQIDYLGQVTNVVITNNGQNYILGDTLSALNTDLSPYSQAIGSSFSYEITSEVGKITEVQFVSKGSGYQTGDTLSLPTQQTNISTLLPGEITGVSTTLSTATAQITVASTTNILQGMLVINGGSDVGNLAQNTTVLSVDSATQITLSANPTIDGAASLTFRSSSLDTIQVTSTSNIVFGSTIEVISGSGQLSSGTTIDSIVDSTTLRISPIPDLSGPAVVTITPPYGNPTTNFEYTVGDLGIVTEYSITNGGNGYSSQDVLSVNSTDLTQPIVYSIVNRRISKVDFSSTYNSSEFSLSDTLKKKDGKVEIFVEVSYPVFSPTVVSGIATTLSDTSAVITVSSTTGIVAGMIVSQGGGDVGILTQNTTVLSVDSATQITLSGIPNVAGTATLDFTTDETGVYVGIASTTSGNGAGATFDVQRNSLGLVTSVTLNSTGFFYETLDTITINGSLIGGSSPAHDLEIEVGAVSFEQAREIYKIVLDGSDIDYLIFDSSGYSAGDVLIKPGTVSPEYTIDSITAEANRFFIDTGSGYELEPSITLYSGNIYNFDYSDSSNNGHIFSLSKYRDGIWYPSFYENVSTTLDISTKTITVADTTGIYPGMVLIVESGDGALIAGTVVESVDNSTTLTLSKFPLTSGTALLTIRGVEYTEGVSRSTGSLAIKISETTPTLYYYCASPTNTHQNEGGYDNEEIPITIDLNNPRIFGNGFEIFVADLNTINVITADVDTGYLSSITFESQTSTFGDATVSNNLTCPLITGQNATFTEITSTGLTVNSPLTTVDGNINIGSNITINSTTGNITSSGVVKTTSAFNSNDYLTIQNNNISATTGNDLILTPSPNRVAKVNSSSALIIPAGDSSARPSPGVVANGAIRFNTDSGQYEGYSATTSSWSSLGGVRDLDGNTYIEAEASVGANDNTLYFYNDGNNTVSVTPNYLQFVNVKKIRSINTTAPTYTDYATNTNITLGDYLKYKNNIYEVTQTGQTATSGNEPVHTTGAVSNGTAELTWHSTAVAPITFEETEEVRIDPLGFTDLVVNAELRFSNNVISTDLQDLIVRPNTGKKVTVDSNTSLVLPVGDINQRGVAAQGSVRFNTTNSTYEGYDGTNWGSLGGVKDVDQNTYIIPELSAGSDENILYFYNNGTNTMRLSEAALDFTNIDTITSQNNNLDLQAQTVTFNNLATTIDTSGNSTFISTTKDNLDLGLAVGINVDPLLRLDTNGDIYVNKAFGTGSFDGLKLISSSFDSFELIDYRINTQDIQLIKGGTNAGAATLYNPTDDTGSRVTVSIHNQTSGDKEMIEYHVIDKGSDIHHTDISNLNTGTNLVNSVFDFDAQNNIRVTFTLTDLAVGDVVNITVVSNTFKK